MTMIALVTALRRAALSSVLAALAALACACGDSEGTPGAGGTSGEGAGGQGGGDGGSDGGGGGGGGGDAGAFAWGLPPGFPVPKVPEDNPMSSAKVELGRRLFYDRRLSGNGTYACGTCHVQELAFTDGLPTGKGSTGQFHVRGSMSLANVAYLTTLTWGNPLLDSLEEQALLPMFGETPVELGLAGMEEELFQRLRDEPLYQELFPAAFPGDEDPIRLDTITKAIAAFERSLLSYRSPYDRYRYGGDPSGMSEAALRGMELFFSEKLECFHCHGGFNLSDSVQHDGTTFTEVMFHNTGLYNIGESGAYPEGNAGVYDISGNEADMGRFRAPTLRNIALTAPYMHDGSIETLEEVLDHYAAGGRTIEDGPNAGVGSKNKFKSELITGFDLTEEEKADVIAFLESLTDDEFLTDPRHADPWAEAP
ncbi:MbnH family di-heme enzyme [Sorangium sp. So ce341]|uniref:MbnH family di-heme enzyme n=1 Tax=Sorangium sp. So ce341 TaxID=3133302 RepID=UPI003F5E4AB7